MARQKVQKAVIGFLCLCTVLENLRRRENCAKKNK